MISNRVSNIEESVTLKLNSLAVKLAGEGKEIFNLTAGQLPFFPPEKLKSALESEMANLKSYQYSPVAGFPQLREKVIKDFESSRDVSLNGFDCIVSNGAKHSLTNALLGIVNPGDEVIVLAPYWISYPEMIRVAGGVPVVIESDDSFMPSVDSINKKINKKTKAIIFNSPNNPSGRIYPQGWVKELASILVKNSQVAIISDEIYYDLSYRGETPRYLYQEEPTLLDRTLIVDGISKNIACTGLRIGYLIARKELTKAISNLQGHTASGANSLTQKALINIGANDVKSYLEPINSHLIQNADLLKEKLSDYGIGEMWYAPKGAFYFMIDLTKAKIFSRFDKTKDNALEISQELIENAGVVTVPGTDFGLPNTLRISMVLEKEAFGKSLDLLLTYLTK